MFEFYDLDLEVEEDFMETIRTGYELEMAEQAYTPLVVKPDVQKKRCPYCGSARVRCLFRLYERGVRYFYFCEKCFLCAPHADTANEALANWNEICERMDAQGN